MHTESGGRHAAAALLRQFMAEAGWTVTTLAERTGVSPGVIRLYLKGERMPQPNRDTGHRLVAGFDPDTAEELFDAWGFDAHQRLPRRVAHPVEAPEGMLSILMRIDAKLDILIDIEEKLTAVLIQNGADPKVLPMRNQRTAGNEGTS